MDFITPGEIWETVSRPGYSGRKKFRQIGDWNREFGVDNWRLAWMWNGHVVPREFAWQLFEDGYLHDSYNRETRWIELMTHAREVYDISEDDVSSGLDYMIQNGRATHLQDIAVRRVMMRRGYLFNGDRLVRIRGSSDEFGDFSPGRVPFHQPDKIQGTPIAKGWNWDDGSIEDFYQRNKVLQVRSSILEEAISSGNSS